jgi:hypothetical protein
MDLFLCILKACMSCMSFLPQELSCPKEGLRMLEFPSLQHQPAINITRGIKGALNNKFSESTQLLTSMTPLPQDTKSTCTITL